MAIKTWNGNLGTNWFIAGSWSSVVTIPNNTDDALITTFNSSTIAAPVQIASAGAAAFNLTVNNANALNVTGAGSLNVGNNIFIGGVAGTSQLSIAGSGFVSVNAGFGTVTVGNGPGNGAIVIGGGGVAAEGAGTLIAATVNLATAGSQMLFHTTNAASFAGVISGVGSLTQNSAGQTATLTGANTYSGGTILTAGGLRLSGAGTLGTGAVNITGTASLSAAATKTIANTINIASGANATFSAAAGTPLTLSGSFNVTGDPGSVHFGAAGDTGTILFSPGSQSTSFNRAIFFDAGTVKIGSGLGGNFLTNSGVLTIAAGATYDLNGIGGGSYQLTGGGTITNSGAAAATTIAYVDTSSTFSGVIQDGVGVTNINKLNLGTLILTGANTYSGTTTISADGGTLQIGDGGSTGALGTGAVSNNGTLAFNLSGVSGDRTIGNVIGGTGNLVNSGASTITLTGANTYSGGTSVTAGKISVGNNTALGSGSVTLAGTLQAAAANLTLANAIAISGSGGIVDTNGFALTLSGAILGSAIFGFVKSGAGTLTLTGAGSQNGTIISAGTLNVANSNAFGAGALVIFDATTLQAGGANLVFGNAVALAATGTSTVDTNNQTMTLAGIVSGDALRKIGAGTLRLTGANTYTGVTTVEAGELYTETFGTLRNAGALIVSGGTAHYDNASVSLAALSGTGGTLALTSLNGLVELSFGADNSDTSFFGAVTMDTSVTDLNKIGTGATTMGGVISGGGRVTVSAGTLSLLVANSYSGGTNVAGGALVAGAAGALGTGDLTLDSGTLRAGAAGLSFANAVALAGAGTVDTNGQNLTLSGNMSGTGALTKSGAGTLTLSGVNANSGGVNLNAGTLNVASNSALGTGTLTFTAGILQAGAANLTLANAIALASGGRTIDTNGQNLTLSGVLSGVTGAGGLTKTGGGALTLTAAGTYIAGTSINAGTLALSGAGSLGNSLVTVGSNATLDISNAGGGGTSVRDLSTSGGGSHTVILGGKTLTLTGTPGALGSLDFVGSGGTDRLVANLSGTNFSFGGGATFSNWTEGVDTITINGNTSNNTITGSVKADILNGGNGNDTLIGGAAGAGQFNQLNGDAGIDTASYVGTNAVVYADLNTHGGLVAGVLVDFFNSIENLIGGNDADTLVGDNLANRLDGGATSADDLLFGNDGNDTLIGGGHLPGSFNQLFGGAGADTVDYSSQTGKVFVDLRAPAGHIDTGSGFVLNDLMNSVENAIGGSGDDILVGTDADNNLLVGNGGNDLLFGFDGNDTLIGGGAAGGLYNQIYGGDGNDTASYAGTTFGVSADLNVFAAYVKNGVGTFVLTDVYNSIENLTGGLEADTLVGDTGANILTGGAGADFLYANYNNVTPTLHDSAVDLFVYNSGSESTLGSGYDQIVNFTSGQDKLDFRALNITSASVTLNDNLNGTWTVYANTDGVGGLGNNDLAILVQNATFVMGDIVFV